MSSNVWTKLYYILVPHLQQNAAKSKLIGAINVDMIMGIGMRCLACGRVLNDRHIFCLSYSEAYRSINDFLFAVLDFFCSQFGFQSLQQSGEISGAVSIERVIIMHLLDVLVL